jgi:hypothetical protein
MQNAKHVIKAPNKPQIQNYTRIYKALKTNKVKGQDLKSHITVFWTWKVVDGENKAIAVKTRQED